MKYSTPQRVAALQDFSIDFDLQAIYRKLQERERSSEHLWSSSGF